MDYKIVVKADSQVCSHCVKQKAVILVPGMKLTSAQSQFWAQILHGSAVLLKTILLKLWLNSSKLHSAVQTITVEFRYNSLAVTVTTRAGVTRVVGVRPHGAGFKYAAWKCLLLMHAEPLCCSFATIFCPPLIYALIACACFVPFTRSTCSARVLITSVLLLAHCR